MSNIYINVFYTNPRTHFCKSYVSCYTISMKKKKTLKKETEIFSKDFFLVYSCFLTPFFAMVELTFATIKINISFKK